MHLCNGGLIRKDGHRLISRQHIVSAGIVRYLRYGVIAHAQSGDLNLAGAVGLECLVITIGTRHAEGEPFHLAIAGCLFNPQGAGLCRVDKALSGLIFHFVDFAVLGNLHIVGVFIQQIPLRRFGFLHEHAAVEDMGHLIDAGAGFLQLAQQLVALVQLLVAVGITVHLKLGPGQLVVRVMLAHLRCTSLSRYNEGEKEDCTMWKQKFKITLTPAENSIVIQSLNRLRNTLLRENRDTGCVDDLLLKVMCAPVKRI